MVQVSSGAGVNLKLLLIGLVAIGDVQALFVSILNGGTVDEPELIFRIRYAVLDGWGRFVGIGSSEALVDRVPRVDDFSARWDDANRQG